MENFIKIARKTATEAGGVVTDFSGKKLDIFAINGYVAGSKNTHQQLVYYLQTFP